jgi:hypothetical protein
MFADSLSLKSLGRALLLLCLPVVPALLTPAFAAAPSADAIAAKKTAVLDYIRTLQNSGKSLIGVQVNEFEVYIDCTSADRLTAMTGKKPAVLGLELMNAIAMQPYPAYVIDRAAAQTVKGGLVTMTWHERNPLEICIRGEFFDCVQKPMSDADLKAVLTPGTKENKLWLADVDALAKTLSNMRARGIVVLFRPYHEMNGHWFWWGKKDLYPQLWDALYDELAIRLKLDNLVWVWSSDRDTPDAARYVPVRHKPDVAGIDVYEDSGDNPKFALGRASLKANFDATPFALTEVGKVPTPAGLDAMNPAWVLLWGGEYLNPAWAMKGDCKQCNTPDGLRAFLDQSRMVSLDDVPAAVKSRVAAGTKNPHPLHKTNPVCPAALR